MRRWRRWVAVCVDSVANGSASWAASARSCADKAHAHMALLGGLFGSSTAPGPLPGRASGSRSFALASALTRSFSPNKLKTAWFRFHLGISNRRRNLSVLVLRQGLRRLRCACKQAGHCEKRFGYAHLSAVHRRRLAPLNPSSQPPRSAWASVAAKQRELREEGSPLANEYHRFQRSLLEGWRSFVRGWQRARWRGRWIEWRAQLNDNAICPQRRAAQLRVLGAAAPLVLHGLAARSAALRLWRERALLLRLGRPARRLARAHRLNALAAAHGASRCKLHIWTNACLSGHTASLDCGHVPWLGAGTAYATTAACRQLAHAFAACQDCPLEVEPSGQEGFIFCTKHRLKVYTGWRLFLLMSSRAEAHAAGQSGNL